MRLVAEIRSQPGVETTRAMTTGAGHSADVDAEVEDDADDW